MEDQTSTKNLVLSKKVIALRAEENCRLQLSRLLLLHSALAYITKRQTRFLSVKRHVKTKLLYISVKLIS